MNYRKLTVFLFALILLMSAGTARAYTNVNVGLSFGFHDVLAPYGTWVNVSSYGPVWRPTVGAAFVPFTSGHWIYTSFGPTWVGTEPWAWCAYHYGHWAFDAGFGWVWVPGYEWSPGPVEWAYGPDYLAWSPFVGAGPNFNFFIGIDRDHFGFNNYAPYVLPRTTMRTLFDRRAIRVHSGMLQRAELQRIVRRPVNVVRVDERRVTADRHATRLIMPAGTSATAMREISRAQRVGAVQRERTVQHERTMSAKANGRQVQDRSSKHVNFLSPSSHPSTATGNRFAVRPGTRKSSTTTTNMSRKSYTHGSSNSESSRSYSPRHSTTSTDTSRFINPRHNTNSHPMTSSPRMEHSSRPEVSARSSHSMSRNVESKHQSERPSKAKSQKEKKPPSK